MILGGIEIGISLIVGAVIAGVAGAVASLFLTPDVGRTTRDQGRTGNVRSAEEPQHVVYGFTIKGGPFAFINGTGEDNSHLHLITLHAAHEVAAIPKIFFNGEEVADVAAHTYEHPPHGVWTSEEFNAYVASVQALSSKDVNSQQAALTVEEIGLGTDDQVSNAFIQAENPDHWTANHRIRGSAWSYVRMEYDQAAFPSFIPAVSGLIVGENRVLDPRDDLERWTMNPALIVADILERYVGVPRARIHEATLIASADACDEKVLRKDGTVEPRYTANGSFKLEGDWEEWITPFLKAMAGALVEVGGIYYIEAGRWIDPEDDHLINDDLLLGPISRVSSASDQQRANGIKGTYIAPAGYDNPTEYPFILDAGFVAEDLGFENVIDHDLDQVNSHTQAQRVANIALQDLRLSERISVDVPLWIGLDLRVWNNVKFQSDVLGVPEQTYRVVHHGVVPSAAGDEGTIAVRLVLKRHASSVYDWDPATQEKDVVNAKSFLPGVNTGNIPANSTYDLTENANSATHEIATADVEWDDGNCEDPEFEQAITQAVDIDTIHLPGRDASIVGLWVRVNKGTALGDIREIDGYDAGSGNADVSSNFSAIPDATSEVEVGARDYTVEIEATVGYEYRVTGSGDPWTAATHTETKVGILPGVESFTLEIDNEALNDPAGYDFQNILVTSFRIRTKCGDSNFSPWADVASI